SPVFVCGHPAPCGVGVQMETAGERVECRVEDPVDLGLESRIGDGRQDLHPPVEVPVHHVRAADQHLVGAAVVRDPGVFQETAEDGADVDVVTVARHAGAQGTDAPDHDLHADPGPRGTVEGV